MVIMCQSDDVMFVFRPLQLSRKGFQYNVSIRKQRAATTALLLRDYIQHHLYDTETGYFTQHAQIGGVENQGLATPIDFSQLLDADDFRLKLKSIYKQGSGSWLTPVEVFSPWYGYAIADCILKKATRDGSIDPAWLEIFEIGGGSGTCMVNVLERIQQKNAALFRRTTYTCIEISKRLADAQAKRAESAGFDRERWDVIHTNFLTLDKQLRITEECPFVLAFEVLDNLPHDKVIFDGQGKPWEAVIVSRHMQTSPNLKPSMTVMDFNLSASKWERKTLKSETLKELYRRSSDPLVIRTSDLLRKLEASVEENTQKHGLFGGIQRIFGGRSLRSSKTGVQTPSSALLARQGVVYVPTGQMQFLESLKRCFPHHSLILSDFDSLPGMVLPGAGGPAVQSIGVSKRICDRSTYLVPTDVSADIFFPVDFLSLQLLYENMTGNPGLIQSAKEFFSPFRESMDQCCTMSGYCPLTEYFSNTSYFTT